MTTSIGHADNSRAIREPLGAELEVEHFSLEEGPEVFDLMSDFWSKIDFGLTPSAFIWLRGSTSSSGDWAANVLWQDIRWIAPSSGGVPGRNVAAKKLLERWLADESGYDERVWPKARTAIEVNRLSFRKRFSD